MHFLARKYMLSSIHLGKRLVLITNNISQVNDLVLFYIWEAARI